MTSQIDLHALQGLQGLQGLLDREAIRECLFRYCRGIDRVDEEALRSAYWHDATDRHGPYQGSANGFIDWALEKLKGGGRMVHMLGNISIQLHDDVAAVESYFQALQEDRNAEGQKREMLLCGRYADRFEKRDGNWRIAARTVVYDWINQAVVPELTEAQRFGETRQPRGGSKPDDPYYALLADAPFNSL
ncbi:nuclear transport factor 2 family protein [Glaciimonas sp. GNP009]